MGYELWLEELEKRGGISVGGVKHKVKLVYSDSSVADAARRAAGRES